MSAPTSSEPAQGFRGDEPAEAPRRDRAAAGSPEASPLWPLVLVLGEIATRVESELAAGVGADTQDGRVATRRRVERRRPEPLAGGTLGRREDLPDG